MKVIFLADLADVAHEGDIKEVKKGYADNFLIKKGIAVEATVSNLKRLEKKLAQNTSRPICAQRWQMYLEPYLSSFV